MSEIIEAEVPRDALSAAYAKQGAFVDCHYIDIPKEIALDKYIKAFYTTPLFKVERTILSIATLKLASDSDAVELALGESEKYSIWTVENRESNQILLRDFTNKTRSWLMVQQSKPNETKFTRLFFGSVVIPKEVSEDGQRTFGFLFHALSRFHQLYSRALLNAAYNRLL